MRFFLLSLSAILFAGCVTWGLIRMFGRSAATGGSIPAAFVVSTLLLGMGSFAMSRAERCVRMERQRPFRRWLLIGFVIGTLFMGVQSYALWSWFPTERSPEASLGAVPFILTAAALHGLHFLVAVMFVAFVLSRAWADRYDHEYHWGVAICGWFWHALGILWLVILGVIGISMLTDLTVHRVIQGGS